jgi:hypothetical protein
MTISRLLKNVCQEFNTNKKNLDEWGACFNSTLQIEKRKGDTV